MRRWIVAAVAAGLLIAFGAPAGAQAASESLVTVDSPTGPFPQNKQNEPSVAIDPTNPSVLAAGVNEEIDEPPCDGSDCPFVQGIGNSGVYFSLDGGLNWIQPTYTGYGGRDGTPDFGSPIGTLPHYDEAGLVSDGDPIVAFGPRPDANGDFDWANGSRLYYSNLTSNFSTLRREFTFKGFEAIAVSHADDIEAAAAEEGGDDAWSDPAIVTQRRQSSATFSDKEEMAVDDAASSPNFGTVYVCYSRFQSAGAEPIAIRVTHSTDGGETWADPVKLKTPHFSSPVKPDRQGCSVDTDSQGTVYVVWQDSVKKQAVFKMSRSFDGGASFETPRVIAQITDVGIFDDVRSISFDGIAGARTSSFPSLDIANGAPTGDDAPDTLALGWSDGTEGLNNEHALVQMSDDQGDTWTDPEAVEESGDRPDFAFIGISPDGTDLYVVYDAFLDPFQDDTTSDRRFLGVLRQADLAGTSLGTPITLDRGEVGDARASSANALIDEFIGDYNTVAATNDGAVSVFNDARDAALCDDINTYRQAIANGEDAEAPAPGDDCDPTFGNTDIWSAMTVDPTP
jgi:hypothetical protein